MNERIRELAKQAGCKVMDDGEWYIPTAKGLEKIDYTSGVGLEKFAELIVKEVLAVQEKLIADGHNAWHLHRPTKKHFGVEE